MDAKRLIRVSKYLSKHLRHEPERLGLALAPGGWVPVADLLAACAADQFPISREELLEVVTQNDKRRFAFDPTGTLIRANQGHSTSVDLRLEPAEPPALRAQRLEEMRALTYDDLSADRNVVAVVQALEAILRQHAAGRPGCVVTVNGERGGLVLAEPGRGDAVVLYPGRV